MRDLSGVDAQTPGGQAEVQARRERIPSQSARRCRLHGPRSRSGEPSRIRMDQFFNTFKMSTSGLAAPPLRLPV
jgi:hypothetical protein